MLVTGAKYNNDFNQLMAAALSSAFFSLSESRPQDSEGVEPVLLVHSTAARYIPITTACLRLLTENALLKLQPQPQPQPP
jgi:hypothetical protein